MEARSAICIAVDGLRASALGAYGNTWYPTPALDDLASQSTVVDWLWCDSPHVAGFYRAVWRGQAAFPKRDSAAEPMPAPLLEALTQANVDSQLITDDASIAQMARLFGFAQVLATQIDDSGLSAAKASETVLAATLAIAAEKILAHAAASNGADSPRRRLLWVHARGLHGPWDAPLSLRQQLMDEGDPEAPTYVELPETAAIDDQGQLFLHRVAYAAQIMALDECLGGLLEAIDEVEWAREALVVLVGCRGFALGEHGVVGWAAHGLYGELLHVPCLVRAPKARLPTRCPQLAEPRDLHAALADWLGIGAVKVADRGGSFRESTATGLPLAGRPFVAAVGEHGESTLRTPHWMLRRGSDPFSEVHPAPTIELYAKPDDRWEANEISSRCPEVAERLLAALEAVESEGPASVRAAELVDGAETAHWR